MQEVVKIYYFLVDESLKYSACIYSSEGLSLIAGWLDDKKYTYEQIQKAMRRLSKKTKFFPSLDKIIEELRLVQTEEE